MRTIKNLIGSILIAMATFVVWVVILPDYDGRDYIQSAIQVRLANLEAKNKLMSKVEELDNEYQSRYTELKRLSLVVPSEKHIEEVITILEDVFSATGVPLKDMSLAAGKGESGSPYDLVSMEFNFNTTYDSVINFLYAIETSLRLMDTTSLSVAINKETTIGTGGQPSLDVLFKARAYFVAKTAQQSIQKTVRTEE